MKNRLNRGLVLALVAIAAAAFAGCKSQPFFASMVKSDKKDSSHPATKLGLPEPNVTFDGLDGKKIDLASLKGQVVLVNFWATWCEPCNVEIPWMIQFQQKYSSKGFTLVGVAMDEEGKSVVDPFVQKTQFDVEGQPRTMNYPIVLGNDQIADKFGGLIGMPTTIVISRDGTIVKRIIGLVDREALEKQIQELL